LFFPLLVECVLTLYTSLGKLRGEYILMMVGAMNGLFEHLSTEGAEVGINGDFLRND